ncbi:ABC-type transport auxiliary lipoprotein family protein [Sulfurovum sp.]|uniref:ABC-type transport auxiliary lipoprotein family protein n=1 Tax=Sulfurovum sp. TaxID=1969726 RepID=UPI002867CDBF|nr:ABC-type transport auxiliary lipoprotein family protein [Sulfurovum sp.]
MTNRKRILTSIVLCAGLLGCTQAPVLKVYSLDVPKVQKITHSSYKQKVIKVAFPQSLREQMSQKMNFSYSHNDYGTYMNSEWSNHMSKLIQGTVIDVLDSSQLFKAVLPDTTTLKVNYRLESNIFAFEHQVRGKESYSVVSIQFTLIDAETGKLVKTRRFTYIEATTTTDAKGYASATNAAIVKLSRDLVIWLR